MKNIGYYLDEHYESPDYFRIKESLETEELSQNKLTHKKGPLPKVSTNRIPEFGGKNDTTEKFDKSR